MDESLCSTGVEKIPGVLSSAFVSISSLLPFRKRKNGCFHSSSSLIAIMFLVQSQFFLAILAVPQIVVTQHHSECSVQMPGLLHQEFVYTAPPRFAPLPPIDPGLQAELYRLFTSHDNYTKASVRGQLIPPGLSQNDLDFIASVCPKTAFFYSMSPQHVIARDMLQRYLAVLPTPQEVLRVARIILYNHEINPKIWYYALMGAIMERPDMSGLIVAQPLDAIPDLFVPAPVIGEALSRYQPLFGIGHKFSRYHGGGGGNGGGFVPSAGPVRPHVSSNVIPGIAGLAPLDGIDSGSYQTYSGPLSAASQVAEQKIKINGDEYSFALNYTVGGGGVGGTGVEDEIRQGGDPSSLGFAKRRGNILRKRTKVRRRTRNEEMRNKLAARMTESSRQHFLEDSAGAESISTPYVAVLPPPPSFRNGAGVRRNTNLVLDGKGENNAKSYTMRNNGTNYGRYGPLNSRENDFYGASLSFGDDDDELDELMRIHKISSNSTRDIRQRILQRRLRRKKTKRPSPKVKRQAFGPSFSQPFSPHPIRDCIIINGSIGAVNGVENKLWYFREDLMLNQHHWYWHQMHPVNATRHADRRAELFFFLHRNLVARYNVERLSNGLPRTLELLIRHGAIIEEGYHPHLVDMNSRQFWTARENHVALTDILHEQDQDFASNIFLKDVFDLYHKILFSVKDGHLLGRLNQPIPIRNVQGIDQLGNTIEATEISANPLYYSAVGIHNLGHQVLGLVQDPQFVTRVPTGVMADTAVTMRDPVFYTFHSGIDNLFDRHKRTLPPYQLYEGDFPLVWPGVAISNVEIVSSFGGGHPNVLKTFFSTNRFPLESGIDNSIHGGDVQQDICAVHLDHEPFTYKISVNVNPCVQTVTQKGMIRIFMAPRFDEYGRRFPLKVQRRLMIQLDVFPVLLKQGKNLILRRSEDTSLAKPWPASLRQQAFGGGGGQQGAADYCGCGFPRHLLIPKGTPQGMPFDLFVMITNYDEDIVQDTPEDLSIPEGCTSPYLFCGIPFRRYPDARPMGYPFDRLPYKVPVRCNAATGFPNVVCKMIHPQWFKSVENLEEYVHPVPNMATRVVVVQHAETLVN